MKFLRCSVFVPLIAAFVAISMPFAAATERYDPAQQKIEEARIRKDIEAKLDWTNRSPEQLDDVSDTDRMLLGGLNESILLRQSTGERFGLFEGFDESTKIIELRLHKKDKITDRFSIYEAALCDKGVSVKVDRATSHFVQFTTTCISKKYGVEHTPYLFDYKSRSLCMLEPALHYDAIANKPPAISFDKDTYRMRWTVKLDAGNKEITYIRNFKIAREGEGKVFIIELPPKEDQIAKVQIQDRLPLKATYNLPAFVSDWGK